MYFFEKDHLSFSVRRKNITFLIKRNATFPDDTRKIIFQCNFFKRPSFQNIWRKYISMYFFEKDHHSFSILRIIYFREKEMSFFLIIQERSYSSAIFLERPSFRNIWKKKICFFVLCELGVWEVVFFPVSEKIAYYFLNLLFYIFWPMYSGLEKRIWFTS